MSAGSIYARLVWPLLAVTLCGCRAAEDSSEETQAPVAQNDANHLAEQSRPASGFASMDANNDGQIASGEHSSAAAHMFDAMDANGDGIVTAGEMDAAGSALGASTKMSAVDKIKVIDTDGDGQLSRQEHVDGSKRMFAKMDKDANDLLSEVEFEAGHKAMLGS